MIRMVDTFMGGDNTAQVTPMFGWNGQPGLVDSDGDGQISFPEFWHAVENDVPQGMLVLRQTFMARVQNATMSANIARNFNFQHTTAWTPPASYVGDVIMGGGSQFCNM